MGLFLAPRKSRSPKSEEHEIVSGKDNDHSSQRSAAQLVRSDHVHRAIENVRRAQVHTSEKFALTVLEEMHDSKTLAPIVSEKVQEWHGDVLRTASLAHTASMTSMQSSHSKTALLAQMPSLTSIQSNILRDEVIPGPTLLPLKPLNHMSSSTTLESQSSKTSTRCGKSGIELSDNNGSAVWEQPPPRIGVNFADVTWIARQMAISDGSEDEIGPLHRQDVQIEFECGRQGERKRRGWRPSRSLRRLSCGCWP